MFYNFNYFIRIVFDFKSEYLFKTKDLIRIQFESNLSPFHYKPVET